MKTENLQRGRKLIYELNKIEFCGLKNIKVGDLLSIDVWRIFEWDNSQVCNISFMEIGDYTYEISGNDPEIAFVFSYAYIRREDQFAKFGAVENLFADKLVITPHNGSKRKNPYQYLIPIWFWQMRRLKYSTVVKKGLCYKLCEAMGHALQIMDIIEKTRSIKKVLVFFDLSAIDSLLVQKLKKNDYVTFALQHGIVNGAYDYIEYKCSHADYLLLWGKYSQKCAERYGRKNNLVVGNINQLTDNNIVLVKKAEKTGCFGVCAGGVTEKEDWKRNCELIELANKAAKDFGMTYCFRAHPYDNPDRYKHLLNPKYCITVSRKQENIIDFFNKIDFTLCGNSTTFCDSIYYWIPSFRYIAAQDKACDVCKGIALGRVDSYEKLKAALVVMQQEGKQYAERLEKVRELLFDQGNPVEKYKEAILEDQ